MLKAWRLLAVVEGVGEPLGAVLTLWARSRVDVDASDVVMAPEEYYMWEIRQERHSINEM